MDMNTAIVAAMGIYVFISFVSRIVWPLNRGGAVSPLDARWQKAVFAVIYCCMGVCCIAGLLLLVLPGRLVWISMALLLVNSIVRNGFIRALLRHARKRPIGQV